MEESKILHLSYIREGGKHKGDYIDDRQELTKEEMRKHAIEYYRSVAFQSKCKITLLERKEVIFTIDCRENQEMKTSNI